jgi:tetratricopeptide (TPR) repeat protein
LLVLVGVAAAVIVFWQPWTGAGRPKTEEKASGDAQAQPVALRAAGDGTKESGDKSPHSKGELAGSTSCRECHEHFYQLWAPSHHGLAMQPFTPQFAKKHLTLSNKLIKVGKAMFRPELTTEGGWVVESTPEGDKKYPIQHVMGGKNVLYFLTPLEHGRLQVLPLAYEVHQKRWYDMPASGIRHFVDQSDSALDWRHSAFTFNTSCYSCHVSQLSRNYDAKTRTYHTSWAEPGINCETCHGPAAEHVKLFKSLPKGGAPSGSPADIKLISTKKFSVEQLNSSCAPCHAKMSPISASFMPGDRYFDHFDLVTLDHADFYPDGRDLGENYTETLWRMSPCMQSGKLSCTHCHTSSGRFIFKDQPNQACMPCHEDKVANPAVHTFHKADSTGNQCVGCHMPTTGFAAMQRTDHSMRPPTPAATLAFKSPNACNMCHTDKDAAWADEWVRKWRKRDYQAPVLHWAGLLDAARKRDWKRLPEMFEQITGKDRGEVVAASFARLLHACDDPRKLPAILAALKDPSPLVRAAAIEGLGQMASPQTLKALVAACSDSVRLVRVRAAAALSEYPAEAIPRESRAKVQKAEDEYLAGLRARPDHWSSHYNLGNYYMAKGDASAAAGAFETAIELEPEALLAYVNASLAYAQLNQQEAAEKALKKALAIDPANAAANMNLGLLMAEEKRMPEAEAAFRAALKRDPTLSTAAYNLSVILAKDRPAEAMEMAASAYKSAASAKNGYNLAFLLQQNGKTGDAVATLRAVLKDEPQSLDAVFLLGRLLQKQGKRGEAIETYQNALQLEGLPPRDRGQLQREIQALMSGGAR